MKSKPVPYTEFEDTLSQYIYRIEEAEEKLRKHKNPHPGIITSRELKNRLDPLTSGSVVRRQIAWRVYQHQMFYIVRVEKGAKIPRHSHDEEDIFRLVMRGSLTVNGLKIKEDEWFVVRAGTEYKIETKHGYTVFTGYGKVCPKPHLERRRGSC